ncbi:hypothetical protein C7M84_025301 [Penaeus vannamei]|uniref:CCHC-type domain-containing protein n=1 Tax=Penaeus vannamei TaxID=6689 RepID=A0A3R7PSS3_PENVA|nr:hypothetical protein C7M84_025301 [Penaeus vannamei]
MDWLVTDAGIGDSPEEPAAHTVHRCRRMVTAAAATLPPLSTLQPRSEEVAEQPPRLPPPVTVSTQHPAPVASYLVPVLGGQPDADAGDRRDTLGHQWVAAATSREPASSSAAGLQPPPPMLSGSIPGPAAHPQPSVLPQPTQYGRTCSKLHRSQSPLPIYTWRLQQLGRDEVPVFCSETPASQGIQRSQELESWISSIEFSARPATEAYIRMARSRVSRYAWSVLNSPVFTNIQDWVSFKAQLRDQFRGVATEFYGDLLPRAALVHSQLGPLPQHHPADGLLTGREVGSDLVRLPSDGGPSHQRGRGRCYNCGETGHLRATCPFGQGRSGGVSQLAGSEVTMMKREAVTRLPGVRLHASSRALQGVSGQLTPAVAEVALAFTIHPKLMSPTGPVL